MSLGKLFAFRKGPLAIDTVRGAALLLVVLYHVIGSSPEGGLRIAAPNPLRSFSDALVYVHMPIFMAISGMVFAMKPVSFHDFGGFLLGKLGRLAIPGAVAIIFFVTGTKLVATIFQPVTPLWHLAIYPYAHFWFLHALLVILFVAGLVSAVSVSGAGWFLLCLGLICDLAGFRLGSRILAVNHAIALLPCFATGMLIWQYRVTICAHRGHAALAALVFLTAGIASGLHQPLIPLAACLAIVIVPHCGWLAWMAAPSFVIYLYHPLATSAIRRLLAMAGIENTALHLVAGTTAGVGLPVLFYVLIMQSPATAKLVNGWLPRPSRQFAT